MLELVPPSWPQQMPVKRNPYLPTRVIKESVPETFRTRPSDPGVAAVGCGQVFRFPALDVRCEQRR